MQQNPPHCKTAPDAPAVAQEGVHGGAPRPLRRAGRPRGGDGGVELQEIRGPHHLLEPPGFQEATGSGRGGIRVCQLRSARDSLR